MNVFIACGKIKADHPCMAKDMYQGTLFKRYLNLARTKADDEHIFILSAKYGILRLTDKIEPYNYTLIGKSAKIRNKWGGYVYAQSKKKGIELDNSIYYLPNSYMSGLYPYLHLETISEPIKKLTFFQRAKYLSEVWKRNH